MQSKFDRLRAGEVVEIEPGRKGRLNLENKTFTTSDGRQMYVGDDPDFFPSDPESLKVSQEKETLERDIKKAPFGEFLYQFGNQGIAGAAKNTYNKITKKGDDYLRSLQVNQQVGERISESSPWTSAAATAASFVPDIALTKGMGGARAGATLAAAHAGPRIIEEPENVAGEIALSGAGGYLIQKGADALNNIAKRRGQIQALTGQQQAVRNQNISGEQSVAESNLLEKQQFNALKQNVKNFNQIRLEQYENDLNLRQNQIIQEKNAYEQKKLLRDNEIIRLKNKREMDKMQRNATQAQSDADYRVAKEAADLENKMMTEKFKQDQIQYENQLKKLPELQKQAQAEHSANVVKNASEIERLFPKNSKITADELGIDDFINEKINISGLAGTREASQSKRIINSLFPDGELIGGRELSKRYKALEDSILRSTPEVQNILNDFKTHLGQKLPSILEDSVAFSKISPLISKSINKDISTIINELDIPLRGSEAIKIKLIKRATANANNIIKNELKSTNFVDKLNSGELSRDIANKLLTTEDFLYDMYNANSNALNKSGMLEYSMNDATNKHNYFVQELSKEIQKKLSRYEVKALESARNAKNKFGQNLRKTYGLAAPVEKPIAPVAPNQILPPNAPPPIPEVAPFELPPHVTPPNPPNLPPKPNLMPEPTTPIPNVYNAIPEPSISPAQGFAERAGDILEKPILGGGKGIANNPLTKLAGLKYLLGKAALPAEAAYLGLKGLTSPTAAGEIARITFRQGGIQAIESWASKYPSYHNGILDNPQERRSLTKEIEDDPEIPIEQKAVIQSKINRGKPIQNRI